MHLVRKHLRTIAADPFEAPLPDPVALPEAPHGPDEFLIGAAELRAVAANLPVQRVAAFNDCVPCMHWSGNVVVAHGRVALYGEVRRTPGSRTAESGSGNPQLRNDVVLVGALGGMHHRQTRNCTRGRVHELR